MARSDIETVAALYEAWNSRDIDAWVESFTPNATWTNLPTGQIHAGHAGMAENFTNWDRPFRDGRCENLTFSGGQGLVVTEFTAVGTHTGPMPAPDGVDIDATGRTLAVPFCDLHRVEDGRITATRRYWDQFSVLTQLGIV
ncbi:nuclear transport factor 2 family protein [Rhodococcus sp. APC 3903]|uniref:ester cyclase n=1 Tax=Rhodococcus sp. APC 3903 TaxID=3035193 RepID=UPI0025B3F6A3|nr:nuclear transport factor 2 family protein [Rhodococcus sp. APC 3903]MDN3460762.1 nuclear transport factor 2 family protein [Rhodococcus sp. APC 3903]